MFALIAGTSISLAGFGQQNATDTTAATSTTTSTSSGTDQTVQLEKFVVTGSNIPMASDQLAVPVQIIDAGTIDKSGESFSTLDLLRKVAPSIAGIGEENATISTANTYLGSVVTLHGLSVLVLVDGHRMASSAAEAVGGARYTDLNMIPPTAIDRIEVLQDGASAIYGSDAVGGVINVILKSNFNGWEASAHYDRSPNTGHYSERSFSLTGGVSNDTTSITMSANYAQHDPIFFYQRPYTNHYYANDYIPGVIDIYNLANNVDEDYYLAPGVNAPPGGGHYTIDQLVAMGVYIDAGNDADPATEAALIPKIFDFATGQTLISSGKDKNILVNFNHKIFGDRLEGYGDMSYSNTYSVTQLNAQPLYPYLSDPYTDAWYNGGPPSPGEQYVPYSIPGNPFSQAFIDQAGDFNTGYGVDVHDRLIDFPRIFTFDSTSLNFYGGLRGKINSNYSWDLSGGLSRYSIDYTNENVIDATNFYAALQSGLLNAFAVTQAPGVLPGNILGTATMNGLSTISDGKFVLNGTPFELPAGPLSFAVGGAYSRETLSATADLNTEDRGWVNSPSILPINKSRWTESTFAEINVPIFGKGYEVPGVHALDLDLAGRIDDYQTVGTAKVPKISLKYVPVNDDFSLRASAGKSFIAPALYELYGPVNIGSSNSINYTPYGTSTQLSQVQFEAEGGSNPDLKPSTATTWTAGFGFTPSQVKGFSLTVDYFQTHQVGLPGSVDQQTIVQSVEDLGAASPYASYIHFGSVNGTPVTAPGQISSHPKSTVWIFAPTVNLGGTWTKGYDVTAEYQMKTETVGKFDFKTTALIYQDVTFQEIPTQPYYSYVGQVSQNEGTVPRWRAYTSVDWDYKGWDATINNTYIPSVSDVGPGGVAATAPKPVSSYTQFDVTLSYEFSHLNLGRWLDGLKLRVGMNNVFNKYPPLAKSAETETNADVGFYGGAVGREYYVDATYKF